MKRILFLSVCLVPFFAKADMDKVCEIDLGSSKPSNHITDITKAIAENGCERNNILHLHSFSQKKTEIVANFCRFDRNVYGSSSSGLVCVLYDAKPRTVKAYKVQSS